MRITDRYLSPIGITHAAAGVLLALLLAACGTLPEARMALPDTLRAAAALPLEGLGGKPAGQYRLGEFSGAFTRSATRLSFFDTAIRGSAVSRFDVAAAGDADKMVAECGMREWRVEGGIFSFPVQNLRYTCDFRRGGDSQGSLMLAESAAKLGQLVPQREGTLSYLGVTLNIRAEYKLEGSPFTLPAPAGYRFERDGKAVGAIELTDTAKPGLYVATGASDAERRAAMVGALALALFWEPER